MTKNNDDVFASMTRTLNRYGCKHRLFGEYEYTSCVIEEYSTTSNHSYTFCFADSGNRSKAVSISRCSSSDTPSKIRGQNQAAMNLNKGDVIFNHRADGQIESFGFSDPEDEDDNMTLSNISLAGSPVLHTRHACFLLALSFSLAREHHRHGRLYFDIHNIPDIVVSYFSAYLKINKMNFFDSDDNYDNSGAYHISSPAYLAPLDSDYQVEAWKYLDIIPSAISFVRYAFYYYQCMFNNIESADYPSLNDYIYYLWTQDSLEHQHEITPSHLIPFSPEVEESIH